MAGNSRTVINANVENVAVISNNQDCATSEDEQPLISERGVFSRLPSIRVLFVWILVIILVGGAGVGTFLLIGISGRSGSASDTPFHLVNRSAWGARLPKDTTPLPHPPAIYAVIIHTESVPCDSEAVCSAVVRDIQHLHMDMRNFSDIAYNFLVGGDGETYEGRSWDMQGAFAKEFNDRSLGVAFIGDFDTRSPPKQQLEEARALLEVSVKNKKLSTDYILVGHRQVSNTDSPGQVLFEIVKTWPHWKDCYMSSC